tara:strand:- start:531 stop:1097 length:567 start_codon:yes stop_codon:yes gene_type:complete
MTGFSKEWPKFTEKYPIKTRSLNHTSAGKLLNDLLIKDIRDAGQGALSAAKCYRTHWKMHDQYDSFRWLNDAIINFVQRFPLATRTDEQGNNESVPMKTLESWGLVYNRGDSTDTHTHWPALWSYCYGVKVCDKCSPLVFPTLNKSGATIGHRESQIIMWPAWISHSVMEHTCDHERIVVAGNIYTDF